MSSSLFSLSLSLSLSRFCQVVVLCLSQLESDDGEADQNGGTTRHGGTSLLFRFWWCVVMCDIRVDLRRRGMVVVLCSERYGGGRW